MISLQFLDSPDPDIITSYEVFFDRMTLSRFHSADLIINDRDLPAQPIELEILGEKLKFSVGDFPYLHNGKKNIGQKYLSIGDQVTIGHTTFKILSFSLSEFTTEQRLRTQYEEINRSTPDAAMIIDILEEELLRLQLEENHNK